MAKGDRITIIENVLGSVMILKEESSSLNFIFSGSNGPNVKIVVPIRKRIACRF